MESEGEITVLLRKWREGDKAALDLLMPLVYPRLKAIAGSLNRHEAEAPTMQPTALVHEVYMRLLNQRSLGWEDREHFFSFSAQAMRIILTDHARARLASKRGGDHVRVPLHEEIPWVSVQGPEILDLNVALDELAAIDTRKVRLIELRYYLGCTTEEAAEVLQCSKATADRDLSVARVWLFRRLNGSGTPASFS